MEAIFRSAAGMSAERPARVSCPWGGPLLLSLWHRDRCRLPPACSPMPRCPERLRANQPAPDRTEDEGEPEPALVGSAPAPGVDWSADGQVFPGVLEQMNSRQSPRAGFRGLQPPHWSHQEPLKLPRLRRLSQISRPSRQCFKASRVALVCSGG